MGKNTDERWAEVHLEMEADFPDEDPPTGEEEPSTGQDFPDSSQQITPMPNSCCYKIGTKQLRLQRFEAPGWFTGYVFLPNRNFYVDSGQLRQALALNTTDTVQAWNEETLFVDARISDFSGSYTSWKDVASNCQPFKKTTHHDFIMARFLNIPELSSWQPKVFVTTLESRGVTKEIFAKCLTNLNLNYPGLNFRLDPRNVEWVENRNLIPSNYDSLGAHPLGLYELFVPSEDLLKLFKDYGPPSSDDVKLAINQVVATKLQLKNQMEKRTSASKCLSVANDADKTLAPAWTTMTAIAVKKLVSAFNEKRAATQQAVMYGHSATQVANIFGWNNQQHANVPGMRHRAEWLHRSAFSFGGLGLGAQTKLESSQTARNLIFGSVEANTFMIRPENTIKRLVNKIGEKLNLPAKENGYIAATIITMTNPLNTTDSPNLTPGNLRDDAGTVFQFSDEDPREECRSVWLVRNLIYIIELKLSLITRDERHNIKHTIIFDPFSRRCPLRFEVILDELVENAWFDSAAYLTPLK